MRIETVRCSQNFCRHHLPPLGRISKNRLSPSDRVYCSAAGFARPYSSFGKHAGNTFVLGVACGLLIPELTPRIAGCQRTSADARQEKTHVVSGFIGFLGTLQDVSLVQGGHRTAAITCC